MEGGLTHIRDVNLEILGKIEDDRDLFNFCLANKAANILCQDNNFWRKRFEKKFGSEAMKYKPENRNWKNHYLKVVYDLTEYSNNPFYFFDKILNWRISVPPTPTNVTNIEDHMHPITKTIKESSEKVKNQYWLLNLGNKISISYPIDRYEDLVNEVREYEHTAAFPSKYFTPADVLTLVYKFYREKITGDQLEDLKEAEIEYADDFTVEQADNGEVRKIDLMGGLTFFEGFAYDKERDIYYLNLGS